MYTCILSISSVIKNMIKKIEFEGNMYFFLSLVYKLCRYVDIPFGGVWFPSRISVAFISKFLKTFSTYTYVACQVSVGSFISGLQVEPKIKIHWEN